MIHNIRDRNEGVQSRAAIQNRKRSLDVWRTPLWRSSIGLETCSTGETTSSRTSWLYFTADRSGVISMEQTLQNGGRPVGNDLRYHPLAARVDVQHDSGVSVVQFALTEPAEGIISSGRMARDRIPAVYEGSFNVIDVVVGRMSVGASVDELEPCEQAPQPLATPIAFSIAQLELNCLEK